MSTLANILILYCCLFPAVEAFITPQVRKTPFSLKAFKDQNHGCSRRAFNSAVATLTVLSDFHSEQTAASAEDLVSSTGTENSKGLSQSQIFNFLHGVPTFTIVDKTGVPYMVVGEDAKLTAYFFTSYNEASRILISASKSSDKVIADLEQEENTKRKIKGEKPMSKEELNDVVGENPWKEARISTVPLDFGVSLSSRGKINGQYFRLAPSEDDVEDALTIDKTIDDLAEGKVPLFYIEDFEITTSTEEKKQEIPLYFQKKQLVQAWKKQNPRKELPEVKVTELFSVVKTMVNPDSKDDDLERLALIPPGESIAKSKICTEKGGKSEAFKLGERIVVL